MVVMVVVVATEEVAVSGVWSRMSGVWSRMLGVWSRMSGVLGRLGRGREVGLRW